ncbi:hypothetical protein L218DRAFT_996814 [Marasmius fiardii PR-910]|nr:hypothetical protein L218DRAFT_996814 [Marasmius fiardii PR-910]
MTSSAAFSLFNTLTGLKTQNQQHPATDFISNLLKAVGYEACQTKRNTHYLYSVITDYRDAYENVNGWIDQIGTLKGEEKWNVFIKYTDAIDPLEEWLLKLFQSLQTSYNKEKAYADAQNLAETCFTHVESFESIRAILKTTVEELDKYFPEKDSKSIRARYLLGDDYLYLQDVRSKFDNIQNMGHGGRHRNILVKELDDAIKYFKTWSANAPSAAEADKIATKGIQIWMLVHAVIEKGTAAQAPEDLKTFLDADELWKELIKATKLVNKHFRDLGLGYDALETGYKALIAYLKQHGPSSKSLPVYLEVLELVAKAARPYFAQAVILAKECEKLAKVHSEKKLQERHEIEIVVDEVKAALESAKNLRSASNNPSQFNVSEDTEVSKKFSKAQEQAKKCLEGFQLTPDAGTATNWDDAMDKAKKNDDKRKQDFENHLKNAPKELQSPMVKVKIEMKPSEGGQPASYEVESNTRLSALLWHHMSRSDSKSVNVMAYFIKSGDPSQTRLESQMEVGKVSTGEVALALVIPAGTPGGDGKGKK